MSDAVFGQQSILTEGQGTPGVFSHSPAKVDQGLPRLLKGSPFLISQTCGDDSKNFAKHLSPDFTSAQPLSVRSQEGDSEMDLRPVSASPFSKDMKGITHPSIEISVFAPQAEAAWCALDGRFADRLAPAELDYMYALFVFGLTSPSYAARAPSEHLEVCRALLELKLSPERAHVAIHAVPVGKEPWVASAYETMERRGTEMGLAIIKQSEIEGTSAADDGSNPSIAAEGKESCNE